MKKICWRWKTCQTHLASISRVYKFLLSKKWFDTVSETFLQVKSANIHRWNIFLIEVLRTLASPQIQTVKLPDKKPGISDRSSFLRRRSVWQNCVTTFPRPGCFKSCWLTWFIRKIPKILRVFGTVLWKRTFYRNDDLSTTCQCRQLKLNPLSTQINIYCLMTNQMPALLVQRAPWTRAAAMLLQSLYFSRPLPLDL